MSLQFSNGFEEAATRFRELTSGEYLPVVRNPHIKWSAHIERRLDRGTFKLSLSEFRNFVRLVL